MHNSGGELYQSKRSWLNWTIAVLFVVLIFGFQTCYAIINVEIASDLGLSASKIGIIGATYTFCFAFAQIFSGALLDRLGTQRVLPIACGILMVGIFCFSLSNSFTGLVLSQLLIAVGASFGFVGAGFVGKIWFAHYLYGFMFSLVQSAASFFAFMCQLILSQSLENVPYRWVVNGLGLFALILTLVMLRWLRDPPEKTGTQSKVVESPLQFVYNLLRTVIKVACMPQMWRIVLTGAASLGTMLCLGAVWGPKLLISLGLSTSIANGATSLSWLGLAFGAPACVWVGSKYSKEKETIVFGLILQLLCIVILTFVTSITAWHCYVLMFLWGFAAGASMLPYFIAATYVSNKYVGTSAALVNGGQFLLAAILIYIPSQLLERHAGMSMQAALLILLPVLLIALILSLGIKRVKENHHEDFASAS